MTERGIYADEEQKYGYRGLVIYIINSHAECQEANLPRSFRGVTLVCESEKANEEAATANMRIVSSCMKLSI